MFRRVIKRKIVIFFFSIALSLYLAGIKWDKCNKEPGFQHGAQPVKEKPESTGKPTETPT